MFEKYFNREYKMIDFPYFVPKEELEYNLDYAKRMIDEKWIFYRWREDVERGGWKRNENIAEKITSHDGLVLEICAGPGGGFVPAVLMKNYNANIMISDLCPTVVREWYNHFNKMDNPPPNIEYSAFDVCDMPFTDNSIDVISGSAAIVNIEGNRDKALKEIFRVLKPGGLFVFDYVFVTEEFYEQMTLYARQIIKERYPTVFWDALSFLDELNFSNIETKLGRTWSNENDESDFANLCRSLNTSLTFSTFVRYCIK